MGLLNFIRKRELNIIKNLQETILSLESRIKVLERYQKIVDIDIEIKHKIEETDNIISNKLLHLQEQESNIQHHIKEQQNILADLETKYNERYQTYLSLQKEAELYKETIELAEYGVYNPHFDFGTSELYKAEIHKIREEQKLEIRHEIAVLGGDSVMVNGSLSQGAKMVKRQKKLMLRAFNGESDSFIADVNWNNISKMEERIEKSLNAINKTYEEQGIFISQSYANLKLKELYLAYEYKCKKQKEKEEQRIIREQIREEEKVRREIEAAIIKAQKEEEFYQKTLDKTRKEIENAVGVQQAKLLTQIAELQSRIKEAENNKQRALSMAQQTKRGHVYVISNIGSFGENIYKIGMTRRLDPMDRIRELGDASVPFPFDVHAIIFSEDAPALEAQLHHAFAQKRMNLVNTRKEFFIVTLEEIETIVRQNNATIEFTSLAEARDYRESTALREKSNNHTNNPKSIHQNYLHHK